MRIGIDAREFKKDTYTGLRNILRDILRNAPSRYEYVLFCNQDTDLESLPDKMEKVVIKENFTFLWDQILLPLAIKRAKIDVFCSPYVKTPLVRICPHVSMISDIIPLIRSKYEGIKGRAEKIHFFIYALICGHRSAKIITLSEDAAGRVSEVFAINRREISVVYPSISREVLTNDKAVIDKYSLEGPYFLYAGNFKPHKNINKLLDAYELLPAGIKDRIRLVLAGGSSREVINTKRYADEKGLRERVVVLGNMPPEEIDVLMRNSEAFVFPSLAEGFGMPPVEAMARGIPVASSEIAPMTESMRDAAWYFDPNDASSIAGTLKKLVEDGRLKKEKIAKGLDRVKAFDPKRISSRFINTLADAGSKKTLFVSSEFPPIRGGISTHLYNLWRGMKTGNSAILTAEVPGSRSVDEQMQVIRRNYPTGTSFVERFIRTICVAWYMLGYNRKYNVKANHCGQVLSSGLGGLICKVFTGTPYVTYLYSADIMEFSRNPVTHFIMKLVLSESEKTIANSRFTANIAKEKGFVKESKLVPLTPGVDADKFMKNVYSGDIRTRFAIPKDVKVIFTAARLAARKGHDNVISAFSLALVDFPKAVYIIAGSGSERERLESLAKKLAVEEKVIFTGEVSEEELIALYNACDIFIMTPRIIEEKGDAEGFGIVYLEAGACAKPVIAGRSGGVPEAVADGKTGILVDPLNVEDIKGAILKLLKDPDLSKRMGKAGRARVLNDFTWGERVEKLNRELGRI